MMGDGHLALRAQFEVTPRFNPGNRPPSGCAKFRLIISGHSFSLCVLCVHWPGPLCGQTEVNDVHIVPREVAKDDPAGDLAKQNLVAAALNTRVRPLKVDVDLVLVPVTITDPMNRLVTGLDKDNFQLFEGSAPQEIKTFSSEDAPVSLGVIFDLSGSMSTKIDRAKEAVVRVLQDRQPAG